MRQGENTVGLGQALTVTLIKKTLAECNDLGDRTNDSGHKIRKANKLKGG